MVSFITITVIIESLLKFILLFFHLKRGKKNNITLSDNYTTYEPWKIVCIYEIIPRKCKRGRKRRKKNNNKNYYFTSSHSFAKFVVIRHELRAIILSKRVEGNHKINENGCNRRSVI